MASFPVGDRLMASHTVLVRPGEERFTRRFKKIAALMRSALHQASAADSILSKRLPSQRQPVKQGRLNNFGDRPVKELDRGWRFCAGAAEACAGAAPIGITMP
ncbi:MAG: hypothetical protein EOQ42_29025 [Mesorhizobium sp.]|uniref:hypothetical protein n=2 Tax=Mesorhizobium TaxID=68287 RepID=UPI000FE9A5C0|nr:hypothetical protein [Mesorhizobium sp.]RWB46994.1 MAG: hypothetical protein EOQ42_29025 [Mesorhizobium sp.]TIX93620.1 MAG: hypothetical protein E5V24_12720 [Mesorhizobium sp.]